MTRFRCFEDERHTARGRKTWYDVCTVSHAEPHKTKRIADERAQHAQVAEAHVYESTKSPSRATSVVFEESVHQKVRAADHIQPQSNTAPLPAHCQQLPTLKCSLSRVGECKTGELVLTPARVAPCVAAQSLLETQASTALTCHMCVRHRLSLKWWVSRVPWSR